MAVPGDQPYAHPMRHLLAAALGVFLALSCEGMVRGITHAEPIMFHGDADGYARP